jgi:hypothetical protein
LYRYTPSSSSTSTTNNPIDAASDDDGSTMSSSGMSEAAARLTLRAPPRVTSVAPNHGAAEGGTAVIARWATRTAATVGDCTS